MEETLEIIWGVISLIILIAFVAWTFTFLSESPEGRRKMIDNAEASFEELKHNLTPEVAPRKD